jgi:hypothetical protein
MASQVGADTARSPAHGELRWHKAPIGNPAILPRLIASTGEHGTETNRDAGVDVVHAVTCMKRPISGWAMLIRRVAFRHQSF